VAGTASTLAGGSAIAGLVDATGTAARFSQVRGVAVDSAENVYVADTGNNVIRKITPAGVVSTFAGSGLYGTVNGVGVAARFNGPDGLALDGAGNLYVADSIGGTIRKVTPAGVVSTLAGPSFGTGFYDRFSSPAGIAVDATGNVYVADYGFNMIRKITPTGVVSTLAGTGVSGALDGAGTSATFSTPIGVAVDQAGNVYVAELPGTIRKITAGGVVSTIAGDRSGSVGLVNGPGASAKFFQPVAVAVDTLGNLYVADSSNETIRAISPDNVVMTLAGGVADSAGGYGGYVDGSLKLARFGTLHGIALSPSGNLYVTDWINHAVRKISP
jgi:sugar lactone lactonase YvrE